MPRFDSPAPRDRPAPDDARQPVAVGSAASPAAASDPWPGNPTGPWPDQPTVHGLRPSPAGYAQFAPVHRMVRMPDAPVPRLLLTAVVVAGLGCAAAIPTGRAGLGWPVAFALVAVAVVAAAWRTPGAGRALQAGTARWETAAWAAAAIALSAVAAVRSAPWLVALCLLTAALAGTVAVAGRLMGGLVRAVVAVPLAALLAVPWIGRAARRSARGGGVGIDLRLALSVLVGVVLLALFGGLLASADAVFADVVGAVLPVFDADQAATWVCLFGVGALVVAGAGHLLAAPPALTVHRLRPTRLRAQDWAVPVGAVVLLFLAFVGVQFAALFGDDDYVVRTTGLTFAEYARGGFWQLLAVSVLALAMIIVGIRWAPAASRADRLTKRLLLGAMPVLCLVIVASALRRMWLYQQAYGFTVLRVLVEACELWLGLAFLLSLVAVLRLRPGGVVRPMVATAVGALLVLAGLDPERFIAEQNVARYAAGGDLDADYLAGLSADAVPGLLALPDSPRRTCVLASIAAADTGPGDWREANLSRARADRTVGHLAGSAPGPRYDAGPTADEGTWTTEDGRSYWVPRC
jgi:hypothetical protein